MIEFTVRNVMDWTRLGMRKAFGPLMEMMAEDRNDVVVLAADTAESGNLDGFKRRFPGQFYNVGIAEQNMTAVAGGLAKEGSNVFIVSFAPFVSMRNYEAVRSLVGYMHLNVKIVALGSGLSLGVQGSTHYGMEDISLMRTVPGMTIFSPADVIEEAVCLDYMAACSEPVYLRLTGIDGSTCVYKADSVINPEIPTLLREGDDIVLLATGSIATEAVRASRALKKDNISCAVYDVCRIKPFELAFITDKLKRYRVVVTLEEHFKVGGLGSAVCEAVCQAGTGQRVVGIGIGDVFPHAADYASILEASHLTAPYIRSVVRDALRYETEQVC